MNGDGFFNYVEVSRKNPKSCEGACQGVVADGPFVWACGARRERKDGMSTKLDSLPQCVGIAEVLAETTEGIGLHPAPVPLPFLRQAGNGGRFREEIGGAAIVQLWRQGPMRCHHTLLPRRRQPVYASHGACPVSA